MHCSRHRIVSRITCHTCRFLPTVILPSSGTRTSSTTRLDSFGSVADDAIVEIAARYDVIPDAESPDQHVRQVHPGNHRKYLSANVIEFLTGYFDPVLRAFGYKPCATPAHAVLNELRIQEERYTPKHRARVAMLIALHDAADKARGS